MEPNKLPVAELEGEALEKVQALEKDLGKVVVAYKPAPRLARLTPEQIQRMQQLEVELGIVLLAYE